MLKMLGKKAQQVLGWTFVICNIFTIIMVFNIRNSSTRIMIRNVDYKFLDDVFYSHRQKSWFFPVNWEKPRIFIFFGTRPEVIKLAPVIQRLQNSGQFIVLTVFTGQHADIIQPFLELFNINVDIWFNHTLEKGQSLNVLAGKLFIQTDQMISDPGDIWMIQGDTTSAMVIATVAFHKKIRLAHVEAGLRTFNMYSPFPEEYNRKTISSMATYHFAPTDNNRQNLLNEGIEKERIFVTGNTVIDAAKYLQTSSKTKIPEVLIGKHTEILVLITIHRRENIGKMDLLYKTIASVQCTKCLYVVPVHPNPHATKSARGICQKDSRFLCVSPLPYEELHWVLNNSRFILTDSGGIQEEATWYNVPTLILRKDTERGEAVAAGIAKLVDELSLRKSMTPLTKNLNKQKKEKVFPYGDGNASERILNVIKTVNLPIATIMIRPNTDKKLFQLEISPNFFSNFKEKKKPTIAVILQVFKRNTLKKQLVSISKQSLIPSTVLIIQNGFYVNVSAIIQEFRVHYPKIDTQHIASSKNLRFHGRFHIAYMLDEDYVSVWDDDIFPRNEWLQYCVDFSRSHGHALVGANGRTIEKIDLRTNTVAQSEADGKNDFVGHSWTLPRVFLRYYLNMEPVSHYTGEDIQLSYALQRYGIDSYKPPFKGQKSVVELSVNRDAHASFKTNQVPRHLLICTLLKHNFKFLRCTNCNSKDILDTCITRNLDKANEIVTNALNKDKEDNIHSWS